MSSNDDRSFFKGAATLLNDRTPLLARGLLTTVAAILVAGFTWTAWAEVQEIVHAGGRVIPASRTKIINHLHGGKVVEILAREGDRVTTGAALLRLDPSGYRNAYAELRGQFQIRAFEAARLEAEANGTPFVVDTDLLAARPDLFQQQQRILEARAEARAAERKSLEKQAQARKSETRTAGAEIDRLRNTLTLMRQQLAGLTELTDRGLYPKLKLIAMEEEVADVEGQLAKARAGTAAAQSALEEAQARLDALGKENQRKILADLSATISERDRLREQLAAQIALVDGLEVRAPVDGIVEELKVTAVGQSVGANEPLMRLVPVEDHLVIEARVANEDIGRLTVGQPARVKVRAYDYLRHGVLSGVVSKIAADATAEPRTGELGYNVTVLTEKSYLGSHPGELDVAPGMQVEVEVEVGERTILAYLTERLWAIRDGAFRDG